MATASYGTRTRGKKRPDNVAGSVVGSGSTSRLAVPRGADYLIYRFFEKLKFAEKVKTVRTSGREACAQLVD